MLCLHLVQLTLVYANTLMIQQVLAEAAWQNRDLTEAVPRRLNWTVLIFRSLNSHPAQTIQYTEDKSAPASMLGLPLEEKWKAALEGLERMESVSRQATLWDELDEGNKSDERVWQPGAQHQMSQTVANDSQISQNTAVRLPRERAADGLEACLGRKPQFHDLRALCFCAF